LGAALFRVGRFREALAEFAAALRINPDFVEARQNLGNVLAQFPMESEQPAELQPEQNSLHRR
jgi:Flp pilus assembly protein TadD